MAKKEDNEVTKDKKRITKLKDDTSTKKNEKKISTKNSEKQTKINLLSKMKKTTSKENDNNKLMPNKNSSIEEKDFFSSNDTLPKKTTTARKPSTKKTTPRKRKSTAKEMLAEYYDLPYRYNETVVRILAQTPTTLFVYWDISDEDRNSLMNKYGENLFVDTKPILIVHNTTKNYSFEIEINDFANSWYIRTQEPNCNYVIELGRKVIDKPEEYIYIHSSNHIISPNDHILFEESNLGAVLFRNVKTNILSSKDFGSLRFINDMDKLYGNIYDVYSKLYKDEVLNELILPSSGEFIKKEEITND